VSSWIKACNTEIEEIEFGEEYINYGEGATLYPIDAFKRS
jgi:hypothetical protein